MLKTVSSRSYGLKLLNMACNVVPMSLGVILLTSGGMSVKAQPVIVQSQPCANFIYGSPIPTPVPVNPYTGRPCSVSSSTIVVTPGRGILRNSTLINPTVINSTISNSVLVNPVIINSPRFPQRTLRRATIIYNPPVRGIGSDQ